MGQSPVIALLSREFTAQPSVYLAGVADISSPLSAALPISHPPRGSRRRRAGGAKLSIVPRPPPAFPISSPSHLPRPSFYGERDRGEIIADTRPYGAFHHRCRRVPGEHGHHARTCERVTYTSLLRAVNIRVHTRARARAHVAHTRWT